MLNKVFSPVTCLGFGVWGTLGSRGWVGVVMLVLRTFPELAGRSVQNLVEIGPAVRARKRDIGTVTFIYTDDHQTPSQPSPHENRTLRPSYDFFKRRLLTNLVADIRL